MSEPLTWRNDRWKLSELTARPDNPRTIDDDEAQRLVQSWREYDQPWSLLINPDGTLLDGHQRLRVWIEEFGPDFEVDVKIPSRPLTDKEWQRLVVLGHKGAVGQFDFEALADWGVDPDELVDWGFETLELEEHGWEFETEEPPEDPGAQVDRAEELLEKWGVELGQLWQLGEHRLICGDCTDADVVERVMDGEKANLLFTSPPYWVGKAYETQESEDEIDRFILDCVRAWTDWVDVDYGRIIVNTGSAAIHRVEKGRQVEVLPLVDKWQQALRQRGWLARHIRIWAKSGDFPASISPRTDVVDQHWEHLIIFGHKDWEYVATFWSPTGHQRGQEKIGTKWAQQGTWWLDADVWNDIQGQRSSQGHIAAFPVELPERNLRLYTKRCEVVIEPFCGSGSTLIGADRLGRKCRAIELDAGYCAVAIERWHQMTGQEPVLLGT